MSDLTFTLTQEERLLIIHGLNCLTDFQSTDTPEVHILLNKIQGFAPEIMSEEVLADLRRAREALNRGKE